MSLDVKGRVQKCRHTMTTVLLIAVVHTVKDVITAPAFGDAVGVVFAQELVFCALLDTVHLV